MTTIMTMTATNHDDRLGEIYPTMLNELNCTFGVSFSRLNRCGRHGHGLWPLSFLAIMVCGHHVIGSLRIKMTKYKHSSILQSPKQLMIPTVRYAAIHCLNLRTTGAAVQHADIPPPHSTASPCSPYATARFPSR